jgi:hypothetical protein
MLVEEACSIYAQRPLTCRSFDCRIFHAVGISAGADKPRVNAQIQRWRFQYPSQLDVVAQAAVRLAARFMTENAAYFPGGRVPTNPGQLAVMALKVYPVFIREDGSLLEPSLPEDAQSLADAMVASSRRFNATMSADAMMV